VTTTTTKPKRRFLRFSLRTLLIFMLVVCVAVGTLGVKLERARKQREAVAWVREMGGTVYYAMNDGGITAEPRGHVWLRTWLGNDFFDEVASVELYNTPVNDVSPLAELNNLRVLSLHGYQVSDVSPLAKLTKLEELDLDYTQVSDVSPLAKLTKLKSLHLWLTQVSDVSPLVTLTKLEMLNLRNTQVSEQAIEQLTFIRQLGNVAEEPEIIPSRVRLHRSNPL